MTRGTKGKAKGMKSKMISLFFPSSILFFPPSRNTSNRTAGKYRSNLETVVTKIVGERKKKRKEEKKKITSREANETLAIALLFFPSSSSFFPLFFPPQLEKARYVTTRGIRARVYFTFHQCASNARVTRLERGNGACTRVHGRVAGL